MGRARAQAGAGASTESGGGDWAGQAEELRSRFLGGMSRLKAQARRGAQRVADAAHDLRASPVLQHAIAARERGNLEAAFWLLNEEFTHAPDDPDVALHYWDVALSLGRVEIASAAGVKLIESRAAAGEPELAAQHWLELIKEAPDVLVSPGAIATMLPTLKQRLADAGEDGPDDPHTLAGYVRRAVRHAVDPKNSDMHPGIALRIFEQGRDINPEAARRAAEVALASPHLHEQKRQRLADWLEGKPLPKPTPSRPGRAPTAAAPASPDADAAAGLSRDEIQEAAARLPQPRKTDEPAPDTEAATPDPAQAVAPEAAPESAAPEAPTAAAPDAATEAANQPTAHDDRKPRVRPATLVGIDDTGLSVRGIESELIAFEDVQAVAVAEIMGLEEAPVTVIDLIFNWVRRDEEPLDVVRLRVAELDLDVLVTRKHALGSDFAALMGDIMERTSAIPLPDPESALGTRITCFENPGLYERVALRLRD
jgi:hypothetical protein